MSDEDTEKMADIKINGATRTQQKKTGEQGIEDAFGVHYFG